MAVRIPLNAPVSTDAVSDVLTVPVYGLNVAQYRRMIDVGILTDDDRIELLEGWLVPKMTKKQPHSISSGSVNDVLVRIVPVGWYVAREEPFTASDISAPEPDVMVVRGARNDYPEDARGARDVALVVEVADATLPKDRVMKKRIYARAAVPIYWLVNLPARRIEVYTDPTGPADRP